MIVSRKRSRQSVHHHPLNLERAFHITLLCVAITSLFFTVTFKKIK